MKQLTWLILLLGLSLGSSRAWAQSGITQQNGRNVTCASDDMKTTSVPGRYQPRGDDGESAQRLALHPGADLGLQPEGIWVTAAAGQIFTWLLIQTWRTGPGGPPYGGGRDNNYLLVQ